MAFYRFFDLPFELRNNIYEYTIQDATIRFSCSALRATTDIGLTRRTRDEKYITLYESLDKVPEERLALADHQASIVFAYFQTYLEARTFWLKEVSVIALGQAPNAAFETCCPVAWRPYITTITSYVDTLKQDKAPSSPPNLRNFHVFCEVTHNAQPWDIALLMTPPLLDAVIPRVKAVLLGTGLLGLRGTIREQIDDMYEAFDEASRNDPTALDNMYHPIKNTFPANTIFELRAASRFRGQLMKFNSATDSLESQ